MTILAVLWILDVLILLLLILSAVVAGLLVRMALRPTGDRSAILAAPHNAVTPELKAAEVDRLAKREAWLATVEARDAFQMSEDGLRLHGMLYRPSTASTHRWAILCHGYGGRLEDMLDQGVAFSRMGFHLLLPDARGHGQSEGAYIGMGWPDRRDIVMWIRHVIAIDPEAEIVLYGISMGAATVMMTSGEPLPTQVKVAVEDCGYTSAWDEFAYQLRKLYHLPPFPVLHIASLMTRLRMGYGLKEASAIHQLARSHLPILCIHGAADTFVPVTMLDAIYETAHPPKEKLLVAGAGHGGANVVGGKAYWDTVQRFIMQYIT